MSVNQTMLAMRPSKCEVTSGIQGDDKSPLQTCCVQAPHTEKTTQHESSQVGVRCSPGVSQEMIQSVVYRPRLLLGLVKVRLRLFKTSVPRASRSKSSWRRLPSWKRYKLIPHQIRVPLVVDDKRHKACIGHVIEPPLELRPEVEDGCQAAPCLGLQPALLLFLLLGMAADQGQTELGNLLEQTFEPAMFVDP